MTGTGIQAAVETITPERAEEWLGKNVANRNIRPRVVEAYARDMQAGSWQLTGESIKFSVSGNLLDGQHRLHAIVRAEKTVRMLIVRGLPDEAQQVMDSGPRRTAGDALKFRGEMIANTLASVARLAIVYRTGGSLQGRSTAPTHTEIIRFIEENPDLRDATALSLRYRHGIDMPPSVIGLAAWVLRQVDAEGCDVFLAQVSEKTHLRKGDAVLALIQRLQEIRRTGRRASTDDFLSLTFRAWNHWRKGQTIESLPLRKGGTSVEIPVPR